MYRLKYDPTVRKKIRELPPRIRQEVAEVLLDLCEDAYPFYAEPLFRELEGRFKVKIDGYRIIYAVQDDLITILDIRRRNRNTYLNVP